MSTELFNKTIILTENYGKDVNNHEVYDFWIQHADEPEWTLEKPLDAKYRYKEVKYPVLLPACSFANNIDVSEEGVIIEIPGTEEYPARRYRVKVDFKDWESPYESDGVLRFEEVAPETPCTPTEPATVVPVYTKDGRDAEDAEGWLNDDIPTQEQIKTDHKLFGRPDFIQSPVFPTYDGKPFYNLMTLETGWGDAGNINVLFALSKDGYPAAACFECSCC